MIKIKPIIFCAAAAFVFSFFTALFSRSALPVSLLKAVIFALVFGAISAGVQFVYGKFLSDSSAPPPEQMEESRTVGSKVDLVVSEEDLPDDKEAPSFFVDGKHILSGEDFSGGGAEAAPQKKQEAFSAAEQNSALDAAEKVRAQKAAENIEKKAEEIASPKESPEKNEGQGEPAFSPINLAAGQAAPSGGSPAVQEEAKASSPARPSGGGEMEELDELPDIASLGGGHASSSEDEVIEDSEFAEEGSVQVKRHTELPDGKLADVKDAPVMAEAIRTVLKKEE